MAGTKPAVTVVGNRNFRDADNKPIFAIVSVKGGDKVSSPMIRDLKGVVEREKAAIGVFITLAPATRDMTTEAAAAGFFETGGKKFPRIQILTIEDLFDGRNVQIPFGYAEGFKKPAREKQDRQKSLF
jgi:site-specific DNA-methyltransferase (adenine-specific)